MKFSAGGWRVTCETIDGEEHCTYDWISKTSFLFIDVTDPKLDLYLEKKFMNDSNGYNTTNIDGTHYVWDPQLEIIQLEAIKCKTSSYSCHPKLNIPNLQVHILWVDWIQVQDNLQYN